MSENPTFPRHSLFFYINLRSVRDSRQLHFLLFAYSGGADGVKNPSSALLIPFLQSLHCRRYYRLI